MIVLPFLVTVIIPRNFGIEKGQIRGNGGSKSEILKKVSRETKRPPVVGG